MRKKLGNKTIHAKLEITEYLAANPKKALKDFGESSRDNIVKISTFTKQMCRLKIIPLQMPRAFLTDLNK